MNSVCIFLVVIFWAGDLSSNNAAPCVPPSYVIDEYNVTSTVRNRFAITRVHSEIINTGNVSQEICFSLQIPSEAFVSGLCLEVGGKKYSGVVQERTSQTYEEYVTSGLTQSRGMDQFHVCLPVGPNELALFTVEYQQMLIMRLGIVRYSVNIQPTQHVNRIYGRIEVEDVAEEGSVEVSEGDLTMNSGLIISEFNSPPVIENPTGCEEGVSVDFGISYRPVPVSAGIGRGISFGNYFIQFFSPTVDLDCICQNFIFVIDKSGSMGGLKIQQAKEAAEYLLNSLNDSDFFNVIAFDSVLYSFHNSLLSVGLNRSDGINFVMSLQAVGGTDINTAVIAAIDQLCGNSSGCVSQITLLTDGLVSDSSQIPNNIRTRCQDPSRSLNTLAFGTGADEELLKTLAYGNGGRYRFIYEAMDSSEQLVGFLETVLCPLLSEIDIIFPDGNVVNLSVTSFPTYYRGDEILVSGEILSGDTISFKVTANRSGGVDFQYQGQIEVFLGEVVEELCLEAQLHAYQLIRQSLEQVSAAETTEEREFLKSLILEYALEFRFVTDLTSLIVSPLLSDGCECPSSCSCIPSSCMVDSTDELTDNINIVLEKEFPDQTIYQPYNNTNVSNNCYASNNCWCPNMYLNLVSPSPSITGSPSPSIAGFPSPSIAGFPLFFLTIVMSILLSF